MALYKTKEFVETSVSEAFDALHKPGTSAPHAGIYRCVNCKHEIGIAKDHVLPPQIHSQHPDGKPILWQLVVYAVHNK